MMFRVEIEENSVIGCKSRHAAIIAVGVALFFQWKMEFAEGDGPDNIHTALLQAEGMVSQTEENRLNLSADGVGVQFTPEDTKPFMPEDMTKSDGLGG